MNTTELQVLKHRNQLLDTLRTMISWIEHCNYNNEFVKQDGKLTWGPQQLVDFAKDADEILKMNPVEFDISDVPILDSESKTDLICTNEWFVQKLVAVFKSHEIGEELPPEKAKYFNMVLESLFILACNTVGVGNDKRKVVEEILSNDYDEICMKSLIKELVELMNDYVIGKSYTLVDSAIYIDIIDQLINHALSFVGVDYTNEEAIYIFLVKKIDNGLSMKLN